MIADRLTKDSVHAVLRRDLLREIRISAGTEGRSLGEVIADIKQRAAALNLPPGYRIDYTGAKMGMWVPGRKCPCLLGLRSTV